MAIDQFTHSLPMMLYRTLDVVMPRFRKIFNDFDLTEQQWRVLRVLWETDHNTIMELSAATLLPAPSLVGIVDRLERNQLVNRQRSEADRRKVNIVLTSQGAALEREIMPRVASAYADLKQSVDEETWSAVLGGLRQISVQGRVESSK
jgi:homoprotocatechuate degradation regulator HpaR